MTATNPPALTSRAHEWDRLRAAFASSHLLDTPLAALAADLDGAHWPVDDEDETPAVYLDLSHEELVNLFANRRRPDAVPLLMRILRDTLAPDRTFDEVAKLANIGPESDNPLHRTLARFNIPEEFPISLVALDESSRELCRLEHIRTLGHFALFAGDLAQRRPVEGDFRRLLDALTLGDEAIIAEHLPFRPGTNGLHLVEALALAARSCTATEQVPHILAWFKPEFAEWKREAAAQRRFIARELAVLNDSELEHRIVELLVPHLGAELSTAPDHLVIRLQRWLGL